MMTEAEGVSKKFDPRFSPAFQPGYDSRVHREAPPTGALRDESAAHRNGIISEPPRYAVPASDGGADVGGFSDRRAMGPSAATAIDAAGIDAAGIDVAPLLWWQRINPWFLVLWVLGIVFIAAGVGLMLWAVGGQLGMGYGDNDGQFFFMLLQTTWVASPMLVTLGLATITSTVVIQATKWGRR